MQEVLQGPSNNLLIEFLKNGEKSRSFLKSNFTHPFQSDFRPLLQQEATQQNINLIYKLLQFFNFELWKSKKLYLRYGFIELVFLFVCPLADKTRANQVTTKLIGVIRHLLASEVL